MAYYFAVEAEKNNYIGKNIRNSKLFGAEHCTTTPYECTLGEIDNFTSEFQDETQLKEQLLKEEIIEESDLDKNIVIFFIRNIERRIVGGNILYRDSKKMLDNPLNAVEYIKNQAKENNSHFFRELSKKLPHGTINKSLVCKLASLLEIESNEELNDKMIDEVARLLIYRSSINKNGSSIICGDRINPENLHNVLSFISDYEKGLIKTSNYQKTLKNTSN